MLNIFFIINDRQTCKIEASPNIVLAARDLFVLFFLISHMLCACFCEWNGHIGQHIYGDGVPRIKFVCIFVHKYPLIEHLKC